MRKLLLAPDADGYSHNDAMNTLRVSLQGGGGRYRQDKLNSSKSVSATWTMNAEQYQYWRAFYVSVTKEAALPFLCDLVSEDGGGPAEHQCWFIPGSVSLPRQYGFTYVQQATLEARPIRHDPDVDEAYISLYELSEGDVGVLNPFAHLINVTAPETIGA